MTHYIFDKTDKGREEIATRKHQLSPRMRTLLLLVDGKQPTEEVLLKVAGLGLNQDSVADLLENGFLRPVVAPPVPAAVTALAATATATDAAVAVPPSAPSNDMLDAAERFRAIYQFYTETIKGTIGLRGYALQLKVEKASTVGELRALRDAYLEAVLRAKGNEVARSLRARLDQLLGPAEGA